MVGPDKKSSSQPRWYDRHNIRIMPHGGTILFPILLVTAGWIAALAHDGCDFARLTGPAVEMLTGSPSVPFVDCGMTAYRIPGFYPAANTWRVLYSDECVPYDYIDVLADRPWVSAEWLNFLSMVFGGAAMMFLWSGTFLTLTPNSWRIAGIGVALAFACQACSMVWFYTDLCNTSSTNIDEFNASKENNNAVDDGNESSASSSCDLFFGSKCVITSCCLWFVAAIVILFGKYPMPVPRLIAYDDSESVGMVPPGKIIAPGSRGGSTMAGAAKSSRHLGSSTSTMGFSHASTNISRTSRSTYKGEVLNGSINRPERASFVAKSSRPGAELTGSTFSAMSMNSFA